MKRNTAKKLREHGGIGRDDAGRGAVLTEESLGPLGVLFTLLLIAMATAILDYGVLPPPYVINSESLADVRARQDFRYNDPDELNRLREEAAQSAPRVYAEDPNWTDTTLHELSELMTIVDASTTAPDARERASHFPADGALVEELYKYNSVNSAGRKGFLSNVLLDRIQWTLHTIAEKGVVTDENYGFERNKPGAIREIIRLAQAPHAAAANAAVHLPDARPRVPIEKLLTVRNAKDLIDSATWHDQMMSTDLRYQLKNYFERKVGFNLILNERETDVEREHAREAAGTGEILVHKGDPILSKGQKVTKLMFEKLHEEYRAYKASLTMTEHVRHLTGVATLVFGVMMCFLFAASRMQESIFKRRQALMMLGILAVGALLATRLFLLSGLSVAFTPLVFVAMVASLAFGQGVTLLTIFGLSLPIIFAGIVWEASPVQTAVPALPLAMLVGGVAAAMPARNLENRWDLLRYGAIGGIIQGVIVAGLSLLSPGTLGVPTMFDVATAFLNGPICGLLVLGSLPLVESLFGILTNIRLFELSDMNQPALRRLRHEAPGTFTHTLQVQSLAEPAADVIGANTRLISAGVLYHDLGKTLKPEYFVENQMGAEELHQRLRPSVSALLITAHVKDGIELAREYGLPQQVIDFIPEHHGTTLVSYFFHSAKKSAEAAGASSESGGIRAVQESFFRYPGPRPRSRETGIVMLADTVEAASRTLANPSAARLQAFVHDLITEKMLDGQLDECGLTFADLSAIEDSFIRVLVTRFHSRIRYPGQQADGDMGQHTGKTTVIQPLGANLTPKPAVPPITPAGTVAPAEAPNARRLTETHLLARPGPSSSEGGKAPGGRA